MATAKPKKMQKINFILPVESISRKFARRVDTCAGEKVALGNKYIVPSKAWLGAGVRTVRVVGTGIVSYNYFVARKYGRLTPVTSAERNVRMYFQMANQWVVAAMADLMAISANQAKWDAATQDLSKKISTISAGGYQTMRGWMCAIAYAIKSTGGTLPQDHLLPDFDA